MIKKILTAFILFSASAVTLYAQTSTGNPPRPAGQLENPFKGPASLAELLRVIVNDILVPIGAVLAVFAFIFVGFKYVTAQGKPAEIQKAHKMLLTTTIGTAILLGAWLIATVICKTVGQLGGPICPI